MKKKAADLHTLLCADLLFFYYVFILLGTELDAMIYRIFTVKVRIEVAGDTC